MGFRAIAKMFKYFSSKRMLVLLILFFNLYQLSVNIANVQLIQGIISVLEKTNKHSYTFVQTKICLFIAINVINVFIIFLSEYTSLKLAIFIEKTLRDKLYKHVQKLPISFFDSLERGDLIGLFINDINVIYDYVYLYFPQMFSSLVLIVITVPFLLYIDHYSFFFIVILIILNYTFSNILGNKSQKHFEEKQSLISLLSARMHELVNVFVDFKIFNFNKAKIFNMLNNKLFKTSCKANVYGDMVSHISSATISLFYLFTVLWAAFRIKSNYMYFSTAFAFLQYIRIFNQNFSILTSSLKQSYHAFSCVKRFIDICERPTEQGYAGENHIKSNLPSKEDIYFDNVDFKYEDNYIFLNANFKIYYNKINVLRGANGVGKTTAVYLLSKYYRVNKGMIRYGDLDLNDISTELWRKKISICFQENYLFSGTVIENIRYGLGKMTDKEIIKTNRLIGIDHFFFSLPNGYYTTITSKNINNYSLGRLISINRAILTKAEVIILDEPDSTFEQKLTLQIKEIMQFLLFQGKTIILISHAQDFLK